MRITARQAPQPSGAAGLQIFSATSGCPSARVILDSGAVRHLHSTVSPESEAEFYRDLSWWGDVVVLAGVGLGHHLTEALTTLPGKTPLVVIDQYPELIDRALHDLLKGLANPVVAVSRSSGPDRVDTARRFTHAQPRPRVQIVRHPASYVLDPEYYGEILRTILPPASGRQPQPRQALLMLGDFFLERGVQEGLREVLGTDPAILRYKEIAGAVHYESELQRLIQSSGAEHIISVNMQGFDGNGVLAATCGRMGIPVVVWFVDDPRPILLQQQSCVNASMTAFTWERAYLPALKEAGFGSVAWLPLAADPTALDFAGPPEPAIPISFVGTSMTGEFLAGIRRKFMWHPSLQALVDRASDCLLDRADADAGDLVAECLSGLQMQLPFSDRRNTTWLGSLIIHTASMKKRRNALAAVKPLGPAVFGDEDGWRSLLGDHPRVHPPLPYGPDVWSVYRRSSVNINVTSCQMPAAVNQRVFDVPAAGGFVLSDSQADLRELFEPGSEAVMYESPPDLHEKVRYFLGHADERARIAQAARIRVMRDHTCAARVRMMLHV